MYLSVCPPSKSTTAQRSATQCTQASPDGADHLSIPRFAHAHAHATHIPTRPHASEGTPNCHIRTRPVRLEVCSDGCPLRDRPHPIGMPPKPPKPQRNKTWPRQLCDKASGVMEGGPGLMLLVLLVLLLPRGASWKNVKKLLCPLKSNQCKITYQSRTALPLPPFYLFD